ETVRFSPDSKLLAAHQMEGDLKVWDIASGQVVFSLRPGTVFGNWVHFRFSPDGQYLLVRDYECDWQNVDQVRLWDIAGRDRARIEANFWTLEFTGQGEGLIGWQNKGGGDVVTVRRGGLTGGAALLLPAGGVAT